MSSGSRRFKKSKRNALRFFCKGCPITYKTAYDEGEAHLINISTDGCALGSATLPLSEQETILISIKLEEKQKIIEARAVVVRVEGDIFAVKFVLIEPTTKDLIRTYFAQKLRDAQSPM